MAKANVISNRFKTEIRERIVKEEVKVSLPATVQLDLTMEEATFLMGLLGRNYGGRQPLSVVSSDIYCAMRKAGVVMDYKFMVKSNAYGNWEAVPI